MREFVQVYVDRLNIHLSKLNLKQRVDFLRGLLHSWQRSYAVVKKRIDNGPPVDPRVNLEDYIEIIAEIDKLLQEAERAMRFGSDDLAELEIKLYLYLLETLGKESLGAPTH
jgi:hypothetical protein